MVAFKRLCLNRLLNDLVDVPNQLDASTHCHYYFERMIHNISYHLSLFFSIIKSVRSLHIEGDVLIDKRKIVEETVILIYVVSATIISKMTSRHNK